MKAKKEYVKIIPKSVMTDPQAITGIGTMTIQKNYTTVTIHLDYLKKAIRIIEEMQSEHVTLAIAKDMPLIIGTKKDQEISGIIIAPRVDELKEPKKINKRQPSKGVEFVKKKVKKK